MYVCVYAYESVSVRERQGRAHSARCKTTKQDILLLGLTFFFFCIVRVQVFFIYLYTSRDDDDGGGGSPLNLYDGPEGPLPSLSFFFVLIFVVFVFLIFFPRDKSPLAGEIKGTHIIVMYLAAHCCAHVSRRYSRNEMLYEM